MRAWGPAGLAAGLVVGTNGVLLLGGADDGGWGTFGVLLFAVPIVNAALLVGLVCCAPVVRWLLGAQAVGPYGLVALGLPPLWVVLAVIRLAFQPLHGC